MKTTTQTKNVDKCFYCRKHIGFGVDGFQAYGFENPRHWICYRPECVAKRNGHLGQVVCNPFGK